MSRSISIREIAQIAGVGVSTVSRVMNNSKDVSATTRERVLQIIKEHNYVPNGSARFLKSSVQNHIGLVVKSVGNPFFDGMVAPIAQAIEAKNHVMVLHYSNLAKNDFETALELIKEKNLCGIICLGGNYQNPSDAMLEQLTVPMVVISSEAGGELEGVISSISVRNYDASREAVHHLIQRGASRIAIISASDEGSIIGPLRVAGYHAALEEHNLPVDKDLVVYGSYTLESGYAAMKELLAKGKEIDGLFAISDIMAVGAIRACHEVGIRVPQDVQVMGFDGLEIGGYLSPSLSTVNQRGQEMGERGVDLLFQIKEGKASPQSIYVDTDLWIRSSSL